ncbi:sigma-70 family RNA polymerase sigma factor [Conexibacter sp. W3-3-2]|uniref:RNA polymerase sigma factor n=1 Tax=Conexibacter sp. W3-3-2 TaxID=2675227 RepID=UPI0012B6FAF9|nr:sigma-70 family RNA polymerase sigma factor [Conexibacter sp. W3-3-2]MTD45158.1 sigma-70 family RNA polymerase sigma factor [Conexibacter sp. W3-3-2]
MALAPTRPDGFETPGRSRPDRPPRRWRAASDEFLVRAAARGHEGALAAIHDRYRAPLERYCRTIVLQHHDAEDAAQSALAAALRALADGRARPHALRAWLYRIAHREALAVLRRRPPATAGDDTVLALLPSPRPDRVDTRADLAELLGDLRALPERSRSALVLHELAGLSFDEIGETLDISSAAARQAAYEARTKLRAGRAELAALFPLGPALALAGSAAGAGAAGAAGAATATGGAGAAGLLGGIFGGAGVAAKCAAVCATIGVVGAGSYSVTHPPAPERDRDRPAVVERAESRPAADDRAAASPDPDPVAAAREADAAQRAAAQRRADARAARRERARRAAARDARAQARARTLEQARDDRHRQAASTPATPAAAPEPEPDVSGVDVEESPTGGAADPAATATTPAPATTAATAPGNAVGSGEVTGEASEDVVAITVE